MVADAHTWVIQQIMGLAEAYGVVPTQEFANQVSNLIARKGEMRGFVPAKDEEVKKLIEDEKTKQEKAIQAASAGS